MRNYGYFHRESGLNSRVLDFLRCMSEVIDYALDNDVDLCVFSGDAYKNQRPDPTIQREFSRRMKRLTTAGIPVIFLVGNHDMPSADRAASSLDIYRTLDVPGAIVADREEIYNLSCRRGQDVQVVTMPYPQRNRLLSRDEYKHLRQQSIEDLDNTIAEIMEADIEDLIKEAQQNPDVPTIFVGHFSVTGSVYGSEKSVMIGRDVVVSKGHLANPVWDYVALGHIHKHQELNNGAHPPIVYPGSLERIDFGEEKESKGFVMAKVEKGKTEWEFITVKSRPFRTIRVDVRKSDDPMSKILDEIISHHVAGAIVRVIIHATEEQDPLIEDYTIEKSLEEASYIAGIKHDIDRVFRKRLGETNIETLTPEKALGLYFQSKGMEPEHQEKLMKHAEIVIKGE